MFKYIGLLFLFIASQNKFVYSDNNDSCHVFLVQVPDRTIEDNTTLSEEEFFLAETLASQLSELNIATVYSSDEPSALQTAELIAQYHNLPITPDESLRLTIPHSHFRKAGNIRTFAMNLLEKNKGNTVVVITHENLVKFIGNYTRGGFKPIPHFSYIELNSDGKSMYLRF